MPPYSRHILTRYPVPTLAVVFFVTLLMAGFWVSVLATFVSWVAMAVWVLVGSYLWAQKHAR